MPGSSDQFSSSRSLFLALAKREAMVLRRAHSERNLPVRVTVVMPKHDHRSLLM